MKIPEVHRCLVRLLAENGGRYEGTNQLCKQVPATAPDKVMRSLRKADKYHLIRKSHDGRCGRGHKSTWSLTRRGWRNVQS
jgi:hypothetical protein